MKIELLELDLYDFSVIINDKVYHGSFDVIWHNNHSQVEVTSLIEENSINGLDCLSLIPENIINKVEEDIEEYGDHRQWVNDYIENPYEDLDLG